MSHLMEDTRLLRVPRYILGEPEDLMQIAEEVTRGTFYICWRDGAALQVSGTGFIVACLATPLDQMGAYVVTAGHVIDGIKRRGQQNVWLLMNGENDQRVEISINAKNWFYHPDDPAVDVAVAVWELIGQGPRPKIDHTLLLSEMAVTPDDHQKHGIREGSEIFMTGVFSKHTGRKRVISILRAGNIALMPDPKELVETKRGSVEAYLIECRSIGGLSGSPAFCAIDKILPPIIPPLGSIPAEDYKAEIRSLWAWIGLVRGHWNMKERDVKMAMDDDDADSPNEPLNTGIAVVIPAWKVMEVINQPKLMKMRKRAIRKHIAEEGPTEDAANTQTQQTRAGMNIGVPKKSDILRDLKKASRKRVM